MSLEIYGNESTLKMLGLLPKTGVLRSTFADGSPINQQQPKQLHEFRIKGHTIMAYSRKDAIKRLSAKGLIQNKKSKKK